MFVSQINGVYMYLNILAEMARKQLNSSQMAELMNNTEQQFLQKMGDEASFTVQDIFKMQEVFGDENCTFEYLLQR